MCVSHRTPQGEGALNVNVACKTQYMYMLCLSPFPVHSHSHSNGDLGPYCYSLVDRDEQSAFFFFFLLSLWDTNQHQDASGVSICPHCNKHRCFKSGQWRGL